MYVGVRSSCHVMADVMLQLRSKAAGQQHQQTEQPYQPHAMQWQLQGRGTASSSGGNSAGGCLRRLQQQQQQQQPGSQQQQQQQYPGQQQPAAGPEPSWDSKTEVCCCTPRSGGNATTVLTKKAQVPAGGRCCCGTFECAFLPALSKHPAFRQAHNPCPLPRRQRGSCTMLLHLHSSQPSIEFIQLARVAMTH